MSILKLKCTKFDFGWGAAPDPAEEAHSAPPDPLARFKGPTSEGKEGWGRKGEREGKESDKGRGSSYPDSTFSLVYATPLLKHQAQFGLNPALFVATVYKQSLLYLGFLTLLPPICAPSFLAPPSLPLTPQSSCVCL